jgi:CTP synthase
VAIKLNSELKNIIKNTKIALFTNVEHDSVFTSLDASSIYKIPRELHKQGLDKVVVQKLNLECKTADLSVWDEIVYKLENPTKEVNIAMVGKYTELTESYKSLNEALIHAGIHTLTKVNIHYLDSEGLNEDNINQLAKFDGILVPGGFGQRGVEGKILTAKYARVNNKPYLGICLGMQVAVIEYTRNVLGLSDAHSTEFNKNTTHPIIALVTEWQDEDGNTQLRDENSNLGGTMRLGEQEFTTTKNTLAQKIYGISNFERHRHRYEVNNNFIDKLKDAGLVISGVSTGEGLVEIIENPNNKFFIATQFHPEFTSNPRDGHPLFEAFVNACK